MTDPYTLYQSPFTWRYGSDDMRRVWSETYKRKVWRRIWLALAEVQATYGLVSPEQLGDLKAHVEDIDIPRALEIEGEIQHDLMAELKTYAGQCPRGGGSLHLGATSMDIEDNADAIRLRESMQMVLKKIEGLLLLWTQKMEQWADLPIIAFTHLQPAEPSTLGYRFAIYAQDLFEDYQELSRVAGKIRGKGFKGAVGTSAAYMDLLGESSIETFEEALSEKLDLAFYPVSHQTYPRKQDYLILSTLAGVGASLNKFAFDLRVLQSPLFGELSEPFGSKQVGSSAMPFKRNPINAEKIDSLARQLAGLPRIAWDNAANSLLERTLDDSANRRSLLPEAFLITDELLRVSQRLISGLKIEESAIQRNLATYAPFAATEQVLMAAAKAGADRQVMHEKLRIHSLQAWQAIQAGMPNPLIEAIAQDADFQQFLPGGEIRRLMQAGRHTGSAPARARELAQQIKQWLKG